MTVVVTIYRALVTIVPYTADGVNRFENNVCAKGGLIFVIGTEIDVRPSCAPYYRGIGVLALINGRLSSLLIEWLIEDLHYPYMERICNL